MVQRAGEVVFDGSPSALDPRALTSIYGEEDWTQMRKEADEQAADEANVAAFEQMREERMASLA
jgi:phosphonate transport system ATP-binding protein